MKKFISIEKKLKNLNNEIEEFAKILKFQIVQEFTFSKIDEDLITNEMKKLDFQGIYFLEIYKGNDSENLNEWKVNFSKKWKKDKINKSPIIASNRLKELSEFNEWIPFYLGKSEKIQKRITEHLTLKKEKSTYALKLNSRESLIKNRFRLSIIQIDTEHYDLIMHKIEHFLRKKYNPIIGKQ